MKKYKTLTLLTAFAAFAGTSCQSQQEQPQIDSVDTAKMLMPPIRTEEDRQKAKAKAYNEFWKQYPNTPVGNSLYHDDLQPQHIRPIDMPLDTMPGKPKLRR